MVLYALWGDSTHVNWKTYTGQSAHLPLNSARVMLSGTFFLLC